MQELNIIQRFECTKMYRETRSIIKQTIITVGNDSFLAHKEVYVVVEPVAINWVGEQESMTVCWLVVCQLDRLNIFSSHPALPSRRIAPPIRITASVGRSEKERRKKTIKKLKENIFYCRVIVHFF